MTLNTYTVISGEVHDVTAASEERALEVFHIWNGYQDGELIDGETCGHGNGETVVLPDTAPVLNLLTALDEVSWILENWQDAHADAAANYEDDDNDDLLAIDALWNAVAAIRKEVN